jgi:TPR repeat protein
MYLTGDGVHENKLKAHKLFQAAAERGNHVAELNLGIMKTAETALRSMILRPSAFSAKLPRVA